MTQPPHPAGPPPVVLGRLAGVYGVRGWLRIHSYTEPREALLGYREWLVGPTGAGRPVAVEESRRQGRGLVAKLVGVNDRDAAAALVGSEIAVPRERMPAAEAGRFYWSDLVGLTVRHRGDRVLGRLSRMLATGAHDVMAVRPEGDEAAGSREILIPFVMDKFVLDVDLDAGIIDVDWEWD